MQFIDVGLTNRSCFFLSDDYPDKELQEFYSYAHPNWKFVVRARPGWDGMIRFLKDGELPAGLFWATKKDVEEKLEIRFRVKQNWNNLNSKLKTSSLAIGTTRMNAEMQC